MLANSHQVSRNSPATGSPWLMDNNKILSPFIFFENRAARIIHERQGYIRLWVQAGTQHSADIRNMFEQARQGMHRYGYTRLLIDQRLALMFSQADQRWFSDELLPQLAADEQVHRVAILQAYDALARLSLLPLVAGLHNQGNSLRSFEATAEAEAIAWLLERGQISL
jgi:hypothetical protein